MYTCTITKNLVQVQQKHHFLMLVAGETFVYTHPKCVFTRAKPLGVTFSAAPRSCVGALHRFYSGESGDNSSLPAALLGEAATRWAWRIKKEIIKLVEKGIHSKHVSHRKPCNYSICDLACSNTWCHTNAQIRNPYLVVLRRVTCQEAIQNQCMFVLQEAFSAKRPQHFSLCISDHREGRLKEFARAPPVCSVVISDTIGVTCITC